jgi:hypothetical protein
MEQQREESSTPRSQFTKGLRNHRKRQASVLAAALTKELELIGLLSSAANRWTTIGYDLDHWLRSPRLIEIRVMADIVRSVNKAIALRNKNRRLTLRIRANHLDSKWTQDFVFCDVCEHVPPELKLLAESREPGAQEAKTRVRNLERPIDRCQKAGQRHGLVVLHSYRMPEICDQMSAQFFRAKRGVPFPRKCATGPRLMENLKKVSGLNSRDGFITAGQTGDLFKVTYAANLTLHLRVAVVDGNGRVVAEYGDETEFGATGSEDSSEGDGSFVHAVGVLVSSMVGGSSPPGLVLRSAEG